MSKPTIEEQIAWMRHTGPDYGEHDAAIIETLERYKRVREVLFDPRYTFGAAGRVHDCQRIIGGIEETL